VWYAVVYPVRLQRCCRREDHIGVGRNVVDRTRLCRYSVRVSELSPEELRRQVIRRMQYGKNVIAIESNSVPPEGLLDVAMTNGLAAIVASVDPSMVYMRHRNGNTRILPARSLIQVASNLGIAINAAALQEALDVTQPMRHGSADDEWVAPTAGHLEALRELDAHPALQVLDRARDAPNVDELLVELYREAAIEASDFPIPYDNDGLPSLEPEECEECWRMTFLPDGFDMFGGTNSPGVCVACGYERCPEDAYNRALDVEWERWSARDLCLGNCESAASMPVSRITTGHLGQMPRLPVNFHRNTLPVDVSASAHPPGSSEFWLALCTLS
jgi:ferredoxin